MASVNAEPHLDSTDPAAQIAAYLDYFRAGAARKIAGLSPEQLRTSPVPSGWAPLAMVNHLVHLERRWFVWGFLAEQVPDPWGDREGGDPDGRFVVPDVAPDALVAALHAGGERTTAILASTPLDTRGAIGGRFTAEPAPTLMWIGFHVLHEFARHLGHLDVARELTDGVTGA